MTLQLMTEDEAMQQECPFKSGATRTCSASACMVWRFAANRKEGRDQADAQALMDQGWAATRVEAQAGHGYVTLKKLTDKGYCGVAGMPGQTI